MTQTQVAKPRVVSRPKSSESMSPEERLAFHVRRPDSNQCRGCWIEYAARIPHHLCQWSNGAQAATNAL